MPVSLTQRITPSTLGRGETISTVPHSSLPQVALNSARPGSGQAPASRSRVPIHSALVIRVIRIQCRSEYQCINARSGVERRDSYSYVGIVGGGYDALTVQLGTNTNDGVLRPTIASNTKTHGRVWVCAECSRQGQARWAQD